MVYKDVLKSILSGVYIVTVEDHGNLNGMTAIWVHQVSYEPQLVGVAVSPLRRTHDMILSSKKFTVNVLSEGQQEQARNFGFKTGYLTDKLDGVSFTKSANGCPILPDIHSYFNCNLVNNYKIGDHSLLIGEVADVTLVNEDAGRLVFDPDDYFS